MVGVTGEPNDLYVLQADQGEPVFLNSEDVQSQRPSPLAATATGAPVMETYQEFLRYGLVIALLILNLAAVFVGVRHLRRRRTDFTQIKVMSVPGPTLGRDVVLRLDTGPRRCVGATKTLDVRSQRCAVQDQVRFGQSRAFGGGAGRGFRCCRGHSIAMPAIWTPTKSRCC